MYSFLNVAHHLFERSGVVTQVLYAVVRVQLGREDKECPALLGGLGRSCQRGLMRYTIAITLYTLHAYIDGNGDDS